MPARMQAGLTISLPIPAFHRRTVMLSGASGRDLTASATLHATNCSSSFADQNARAAERGASDMSRSEEQDPRASERELAALGGNHVIVLA